MTKLDVLSTSDQVTKSPIRAAPGEALRSADPNETFMALERSFPVVEGFSTTACDSTVYIRRRGGLGGCPGVSFAPKWHFVIYKYHHGLWRLGKVQLVDFCASQHYDVNLDTAVIE